MSLGYDKILLIKLDHIGDMVLTTPLIEAVKKRYPKSILAVMASETSAEVLIGNPYVDKIYRYQSPMFDRDNIVDDRMAAENLSMIIDIRKESFDLVMELRGDLCNIPLQKLLHGEFNISYNNHSHFWPLLNDSVEKRDGRHVSLTQFDLAALADVPLPATLAPKIYLSNDDIEWRKEYLRINNIPKEALYIVVSPGGGWFLNWWPQEAFSALCLKIIKEYPTVYIIMVGGKAEKSTAERIAQLDPDRMKSSASQTTIHQMAALMSGALFTVCNDGGPMHISTAVGAPVIALFGPSPHACFGPLGKGNTVISKNYHCSPCPQFVKNHKPQCLDNRCMKAITVSEVFESVKVLFKRFSVQRKFRHANDGSWQ